MEKKLSSKDLIKYLIIAAIIMKTRRSLQAEYELKAQA